MTPSNASPAVRTATKIVESARSGEMLGMPLSLNPDCRAALCTTLSTVNRGAEYVQNLVRLLI